MPMAAGLTRQSVFAGFPDAKGREKESGYSAAWKVIAEGVVPRTLNSIYTDGQDPTLATNVEEDEVGLTDIDCDSPRLREFSHMSDYRRTSLQRLTNSSVRSLQKSSPHSMKPCSRKYSMRTSAIMPPSRR